MSYPEYSSRAMMKYLDERQKPSRIFLDLFFNQTETHTSEAIDLDVVPNNISMSQFVASDAEAHVVAQTGFDSRVIKPTYIKEKMIIKPDQLTDRQAGQTIYGVDPASNLSKKRAENLAFLQDRLDRRLEWMASRAVLDGQITISGHGIDSTVVDFGRSSSHDPAALSGNFVWGSGSTSDITGNIRAWKGLVGDDQGLNANIALIGRNTGDRMLADEPTRKLLDTRQSYIGRLAPESMKGLSYFGYLHGLEFWEVNEQFDDGSGAEPFIGISDILIGSTQAQCVRHFGLIKDLSGLYAAPYFAKQWENPDPSGLALMVQSAPLMAVHQPDAFVKATVTS